MNNNKSDSSSTKPIVELIEFLELTKKGVYSPIEKSSLPYVRVAEETEVPLISTEIIYYNLA